MDGDRHETYSDGGLGAAHGRRWACRDHTKTEEKKPVLAARNRVSHIRGQMAHDQATLYLAFADRCGI
jgi:hypothetical protein